MTGESENKAIGGDGEQTEEPGPEAVAAYLRAHPDFLTEHPEILEVLTPPSRWSGDGVVDMQQFVLDRLRGEIDNLRSCAIDLIETSRVNMSSQSRTNTAVLALLGATDLDHAVRIIVEDLPLLLDVDVIALGFEPPEAPNPGLVLPTLQRLAAGTVDEVVGAGKDVTLATAMTDDGTLFGGGAGLVRSAGFARLRAGQTVPEGLLALGSRREGTFHSGQGTEVLTFLARVIERSLHGWLERSA